MNIDCFDWRSSLLLMPEERKTKALRYRHEKDRCLCVGAYVLLCQALREYDIYGPLEFVYSEHGKPRLADYSDINFNISHCAGVVACVVGENPVGVDVQNVGPVSDSVSQRVFCANELQLLNTAEDKDCLFAQLWTRKEAYLKMLGIGVHNGLQSVDTTGIEGITTFMVEKAAVSACGESLERTIAIENLGG